MEVKYGGIYLYEPPTQSSSAQASALIQSGAEQAGYRPYIIVSRDIANQNKPTAVGVPLSRKIEKANSYRIMLPAAELLPDVGCGPFDNSVALCDHIRVLDLAQIRKKIGRLSENAILSVGGGLAFLFNLR
jgi:mRNA-degrading endonuclease toxin of MazEF toxin-antitoxin module